MANFDFTDFYIRYKGHPTYSPFELIEDEVVRVIVMKVEMILFTDKGEVLGEPNFGADLNQFLHQTRVSADFVKKQIVEQLLIYVPELDNIQYFLNVEFAKNPPDFQDVMFIDFRVQDAEINAYFA